MAWRSHGSDHAEMVQSLKENTIIKSEKVEKAMLKVDRGFYVASEPYMDRPQKIGFGATISAPHMAGESGKAVGVEHIPELMELSLRNVQSGNPDLLENGSIKFIIGDGRDGCLSEAPYDAIHVGAAAETIPRSLLDQLKPNGVMVLPVGSRGAAQDYMRVTKDADGSVLPPETIMSVRYVPLTSVLSQMTGRTDAVHEYHGFGDIEMLVDDTLLTIFSFLTLRDWLKLESVSRRWNYLIKKQWRSLESVKLTDFLSKRPVRVSCDAPFTIPQISLKTIRGLGQRCGKTIRRLSGDGRVKLSVRCLDILASSFQKLVHLDLSNILLVWEDVPERISAEATASKDADWEEMELILERRVEELSIGGVFGNLETFKFGSSLDEFAMSYHSTDKADQLMFKIFSSMPAVKFVYLEHSTLITGKCLLALNSQVMKLDLSFCRRITTETMALVLTSLPHLIHISLYSCYKLSGSCLNYLPPSLESADLSFCDALDPESLRKFVKAHPRLKSLNLSHIKGLTDSVLFAIAECQQMESIVLSHFFKDTGYVDVHQNHPHDITRGLKAICSVPTLKSIDFSKNDFIEDGTLVKLSRECNLIEDLNVSCLNFVTAVGFASLGKLCHLKKLDISANEPWIKPFFWLSLMVVGSSSSMPGTVR